MIRRTVQILFVALFAFFVVGCAKVQVRTVAPTSPPDSILANGKVSAVEVSVDGAMDGGRAAILTKNKVPALMKKSMQDSLRLGGHQAADGIYTVKVVITSFAMPKFFAKDQINFTVAVLNAEGETVKGYTTQSHSIRGGSNATRITRVASDASQKALNGL